MTTKKEAKPEVEALAPEVQPTNRVIHLPVSVDVANEALAAAEKDGYIKVVGVYSVTAPTGASQAFAVLTK